MSRCILSLLRLLAGAASIAALTACSPGGDSTSSPESEADARPSIILLSLDTLRVDHIGSYGYPRPTSPRLDEFAADAVRFTGALAQATGTLPSHMSMLASLNPPQFRITRADGSNDSQHKTQLRLPDAAMTLAEALSDNGYETAAFTDGGFMSARYGQDQGFDRYETNSRRGLRTTVAKLGDFLTQRTRGPSDGGDSRPSPLFLFLHTFDIHGPYRAPEPFARAFSQNSYDEVTRSLGFEPLPQYLDDNKERLTEADVAEVRALYDNGIAWTDDSISALFDLLSEHGLYEHSAIVVLSDHGEEFFEHGAFGHGPTVYQEQVHVPLVIRLPGGRHAGRVVEAPVALIDVAPTLLEIAGLPVPPNFQGTSLRGVIEGTEGDGELVLRPVYFESPRASTGQHGLRRGRWKLIRNESRGVVELYDLSQDPLERTDLAEQTVAVREELSNLLSGWVEEMERSGRREGWFAVPQTEDRSEEERATLRALGYIE